MVAVDGSGCVGPTGSPNRPTEEAVSQKDIDDAAGTEGCRCSNNKFIEILNIVGS